MITTTLDIRSKSFEARIMRGAHVLRRLHHAWKELTKLIDEMSSEMLEETILQHRQPSPW